MDRRDKLFAHVDTGSDRPSPELVTLRAARDLMTAHGYGITEIENAIAEVEEHTCLGCGGPLDKEGAHGRCATCEDRAEARAS